MFREYKYLKERSYYINLYDKLTVEDCLRVEESFNQTGKEKLKEVEGKEDYNEYARITNASKEIGLIFLTGQWWEKKSATIDKWMDRDKRMDEKVENAELDKRVNCLICSREMDLISKDLMGEIKEDDDRILFMYECPTCHKRRAFYNNGEEYQPKKHFCPKCNSELPEKSDRVKNKIITKYFCSCGYEQSDELDLSSKKEDDSWLKHRDRFCLAQDKGQDYLKQKHNLEQVMKFIKEQQEKEKNKDLYDKLAKLEKLNIAGLKSKLNKAMEGQNYSNLELSQPEMGKDLIISFTVQDDRADRGDYDSRQNLKKLINSALDNTNWRLMSEGLSYRLGILSGRLRGYEREEDLLNLVKYYDKEENKKISH